MMTLFSITVVLHFLIFCSSSSLLECYALLLSVLLSCMVFMSHSCSHLLSILLLTSFCLQPCQPAVCFCVPNHFALLVFQGAGTLTRDMEVHLPRHEQPRGINRNHQLYNMPMSPGWGLKPQQRGIIFFHKHCNMVHKCWSLELWLVRL